MATRDWDDTKPAATAAANTLHTIIQTLSEDTRETYIQGGHKDAAIAIGSSNEETRGKHCVGIEGSGGGPGNDDGTFTIWDFAGTTPLFRVHGSGHANALEISALNSTLWVGTNITTGTDPGHLHTVGGIIGGLSGAVVVTGFAKTIAFRWNKGSGAGTQTILRLDAQVGTPPSGGPLTMVFHRTTRVPGIGDDVFTLAISDAPLGTVSILDGDYRAEQLTITNDTITDGLMIVVEITATNGVPQDLVCNITATV